MNDGKFRNEKSLTDCPVTRAQVHDDAFTRRYFFFCSFFEHSSDHRHPHLLKNIPTHCTTNPTYTKQPLHLTVNDLLRAMAPTQVHPPPETAHRDCAECDEHFLSVAIQEARIRGYQDSLQDSEAQQILHQYRSETDQNLKHVKDLLASHGDVICKRWTTSSQEKRTKLIAKASAMFATVSSERDTWKENQNALVKWLDLVGLAQDFTKLLALLHVRTEYEPHLWAPFDTRSSYAAFSTVKGDMYSYNAKSVIMHGKHYGVLKDFDVHSAHGWAELGFPRAVITFEAQRAISIMLRKAVDLLIIDSKASGNSKWTSRVSKGLRSANEGVFWGAYHNQEFAPPAASIRKSYWKRPAIT